MIQLASVCRYSCSSLALPVFPSTRQVMAHLLLSTRGNREPPMGKLALVGQLSFSKFNKKLSVIPGFTYPFCRQLTASHNYKYISVILSRHTVNVNFTTPLCHTVSGNLINLDKQVWKMNGLKNNRHAPTPLKSLLKRTQHAQSCIETHTIIYRDYIMVQWKQTSEERPHW